MKNPKVVKYWRTEPVNKDCSGMWSGYHESEEDAIKYIMASIREGGIYAFFAEDFEVLPYYVVKKD